MIPSKVLWGEGLFLRPQHFQQQDLYHEHRLTEVGRAAHPYLWGIQHIEIDLDALSAGVLRLNAASVIFPDGELYAAPGADLLPDPINLSGIKSFADSETFHLAIAPLRSYGSNFSKTSEDNGTLTRYHQINEAAPDLYTNAVESEVSVLKKSVRLIAESDPREQYVALPILRINRTATGGFELDASFIPASIAIEASPTLLAQLRRLLDILQAKVNALYGHHREPAKNIIEFRSGDIASFWLLHTASSAYASLLHLFQHAKLHPERLFQQLLALAGALMTFSKSYALADLPQYNHADPGSAFNKLDAMIRDLLETVISTRYFAIALSETKPSFWLGRIDSERIDANTSFYIGVGADMPPAELVEAVPMRFKIGAPDDVEKLVLSAMPGVRLVAAPQVPAPIPVRPGNYYFSIEGRGALFERMLQSQSAMIYVPAGFNDLKLELIAVT